MRDSFFPRKTKCQSRSSYRPGRGIEYSLGRCEIWTRPEGIQASISLSGFMCYRTVSTETTGTTTSFTATSTLTTVTVTTTVVTSTISVTSTATVATALSLTSLVTFRGVDGGVDRVCRGGDPNDNNPSHFEVFSDVDYLEGCKDLCRIRSDCVGIESIGRRGAAQRTGAERLV